MARYTEVTVGERADHDSDLLLIHAREARDAGRPLVILIHGLHGDGYGTWKAVLNSPWMRESRSFDVGLVNYASGYKRYRHLVQIPPEEIAGDLANEISQISPKRIVLVGHSMGGLIARETLRQLNERYGLESPHTKSIAGIVTLCTPYTGSGASPLLHLVPGPAWRDRRALRRHSQLQRAIELFFSTWVEVDSRAPSPGKLHVPTFGASAARDIVVNRMGAELGVPAEQRRTLPGGHRTALREDSTNQWLESAVGKILAPRTLARAQPAILAEYNGSAAYPHWESAYRIALEKFTEDYGDGSIGDFPAHAESQVPDLIVRAYSAHVGAEVPEMVQGDVRRQDRSNGRTALGISPIGDYAHEAVRNMEASVNAPRLRWFRAVNDSDAEVIAAFREFFNLTASAAKSRGTSVLPQANNRRKGLSDGV